ncbi:MAG: hypothetical protein AAFY19_11285 [Pseudomonadota bacterium]
MRTITVTRGRGGFGAARAMGFYVDGQKVGNLMQTKSLEIQVPDDAIEIHGKMDWSKTEPFELVSLEDGAHIVIATYFTLNPLRNLGLMAMPARWTVERSQGLPA